MLNKLFPFKLYVHVFQLEGYSSSRFATWVSKNYFTRSLEKKKPLVWTGKAKAIYLLAVGYAVIALVVCTMIYGLFGLGIGVVLSTQAYIFISLGQVSMIPYEYVNRLRVKRIIRSKISRLKKNGLIVIGITGSFGKTTTKEFLYQLLKTQYKVLKTPESYNTLFGIAKVVDLELTAENEVFICEMGAYCRGEIKELCDVVLPDHGILTGINEQHLERFGSLTNTIKAKFELLTALPAAGYKVINIDNANVKENYSKYVADPIDYGTTSVDNYYKNLHLVDGTVSVKIKVGPDVFELQGLTIYGRGNISDLLGACVLASKLGVSKENILKGIKTIRPVSHRLELKEYSDRTVIDDAYSSNIEGFKIALEVLNSYQERTKVIVTPGIVELGKQTSDVHKALSKLVNEVCDYAVLVGKSARTTALASQIAPEKLVKIKSIREVNAVIDQLNLSRPVILIENDLPENY